MKRWRSLLFIEMLIYSLHCFTLHFNQISESIDSLHYCLHLSSRHCIARTIYIHRCSSYMALIKSYCNQFQINPFLYVPLYVITIM